MSALYNEIDDYAVRWLSNLIDAGHIAAGTVDARSVVDLRAADVVHATQFHAFAGIGVWSYALRLANWPDDAAVWTASCPCQPFSTAGRRKGFIDERHLWPVLFDLICQCRPPIIFGEQVSSPDGLQWFDAVQADLEGAGYAVGAIDSCAASVGAPHQRHRLYFVAVAHGERLERVRVRLRERRSQSGLLEVGGCGEIGAMANTNGTRSQGRRIGWDCADQWVAGSDGMAGRLGDPSSSRGRGNARSISGSQDQGERQRLEPRGVADLVVPSSAVGNATRGFWANAAWLYHRDDKYRPVESKPFAMVDGASVGMGTMCPGAEAFTHPLASHVAGRVARLRGYGNAIVAPHAAEFIGSVIDLLVDRDV